MNYCAHCSSSMHSNVLGGTGDVAMQSWHDNDSNEFLYNEAASIAHYDLTSLRRQNSAASPLVVAPMMMPSLSSSFQESTSNRENKNDPSTTSPTRRLVNNNHTMVQRIIYDYTSACHFYGCGDRVNAGILTTFRFSLPALRVSAGSFHDADMLALAEVLLKYGNGPLRYIQRLDFSITAREGKLPNGGKQRGFRSHGALALSKVLQHSDYIREVHLQRNRIGPYGASAIFIACSQNPVIQELVMRRCRVGQRGALAFAEFIIPSSECGLHVVDLSANYIGYTGSVAIERALIERAKKRNDLHTITVDLEGNLVFPEIMNGVTHGLGVLLAFLGSYILSRRVSDMSSRHRISCAVYSTSLIVLYMSSTLYHSFFTLQNTKYIFEVFDKCAIYILIAGSYTPFLIVVLWHEPLYSVFLLTFIWVCCFLGICVEAFLPDWNRKATFSLAMYLGMGWSALICLPEVLRILPEGAMNLMVLGGVGYTTGVPFFVRNNNLDHALWHLFVLAGSIFHWCGIYFYVTQVS